MKIGIMSMQRIINYGSYMQALGLKHTIEELGHEVVFVDYKTEPCINLPVAPKRSIPHIGWKIMLKKLLGRLTDYDKECIFFSDYSEKMLPHLGVQKTKNYNTKVDTLVIGSDEVFNCLQNNQDVGFSMELFGENNHANKLISYAGSFGNTTYERLKKYGVDERIKGLLEKFDKISIRDRNSGNVVMQLLGEEPLCHLDPVLVSDFTPFIKDDVKISDYIIVYGYSGRINAAEAEIIKEFAKRRKKKLIAISGTQKFCDDYIAGEPEEIVAYFKHADCIVTDTFHGSIFSIINERPFVTIVRESQGESYGNAEKIVDMLERLGLQDRIITDFSKLDEVMNRSIDYAQVRQIRTRERERTIQYLKENL